MASLPRDRFDDIPSHVDRVGAHRAPRPAGRGWIAFSAAVVATAALIVAGLFGVSLLNPAFEVPFVPRETETPTPTPTVIETADPITDPTTVDPERLQGLTIAVLNGTPTTGLANVAADQIAAAGWPDPSRAAASERDEELSVVYYANPADEGIARGLMALLGASDVQQSDAFPAAQITIVLGADYAPPAAG
ncbi:MAG TPA: LytR C-terminal domain-containing protein [Protaetiibacter sp.]|nr:LytR C-terminal domain-containing protein [Protaetiibacter sp.]